MRPGKTISHLERRIVEICSPTLAGLKTGSLFSIRGLSKEVLLSEVRDLNRRFRSSGLLLLPLKRTEDLALLYLYRPKALRSDLMRPQSFRILQDFGYRSTDMTQSLLTLCRRLQEDSAFPHEIGLFLGYPPKDVEGFIRDPDCPLRSSCKGCWKVYSDPEGARRIFRRYRKCTACYLKRIQEGSTLEQLIVSGL